MSYMSSKEIKDLYDKCSHDYDEHMLLTGHYYAQKEIMKHLIPSIKEPILDLACGTGFLAKELLHKFKDISLNDFSDLMTKKAEENYHFKITNDNAETLQSYKDKKFKTIICSNLFFYIQDKDKAITRWKQLLDKNAKLILIEEYPFITPRSEEMDPHTKKLMSLINPLSIEEVESIMSSHNLKLVKKEKVMIDKKHELFGLIFEKI